MQRRFFDNVDAMQRFVRSLVVQVPRMRCGRCQRSEALVLHDYVYKQLSSRERICVGKRLFCSNRSQRSGCGATLRLSLSSRVPQAQYGCAALSAFIMALIAGLSIRGAYCRATGTGEARNSYRWLRRLHARLSHYRERLGQRTSDAAGWMARVIRLRLLLPTFQALADKVGEPLIARFQLRWQDDFL